MTSQGTIRARFAALAVALLAALAIAFAPVVIPSSQFAPVGVAHAGDLTGNDAGDDATDGADGATAGGSGSGTADAGSGTAAPIAGPVPNVIVTNFTYGDGSVAVGSDFTLTFTFQNKGRVAVSNMVVTVDGGENFAIAGGTNTFYFDALYAGRSATQSVPMQVLSSAKSGAQGVTVGFRYEYVDSGARSSTSSDVRISVPVSQPDRFQLDDPVPPTDATAGTETTITMNYVNKGKGDISNVEASIEGEGIETTAKTQYIGNVASGASGSIGFAFTPTSAGSVETKLRVSYEDSDGKQQSKEFPVTVTVAEAAPASDADDIAVDDQSANQGVPAWAWGLVAVGVVVAIVVVVLLVRRRKRRKARKDDIDEEWDEWNKDGGDRSGSASGPQHGSASGSQTVASSGPASVPATGGPADPEATQLIAPADAAADRGADAGSGRSGRARKGRA